MLRWLLVLILFLSAINLFSQPVIQRTTGANTVNDPRLMAGKNLYVPRYIDTIAANVDIGIDTCGALIFTYIGNSYWQRACGPKRWVKILNTLNGGLQQVTDINAKTIDTIIATGVRTQDILADTLDQDDFEIDVFPDLQVMSDPAADSSILGSMFNWVVANKTAENIKAVLQVGDLTSTATTAQFTRIDSNYDKLDAANVTYLAVPGNHDYDGGNVSGPNRPLTIFDSYMGPARFAGKPYYGGNFNNSNGNYYIKFDASGHKYLVLGLEFIPTDSALNWAQGILDANQDRETIIATHAYMTWWGEKSMDTSKYATAWYGVNNDNDGQDIWNKFLKLKKNKQIFMIVNGHFIFKGNSVAQGLSNTNLSPPAVARITEAGEAGNVIHQMVVNYQTDSMGGNGYFMRMKFKPRTGKLDISFFSPYVNRYDARNPSYTLDYPAIKVDGSIGISAGNLNAAGDVRVDSNFYITKLPKHRLLVSDVNGRVDTVSNSDSASFFASYGIDKRPQARKLTVSDLPLDSGKYILNQIAYPQTANYRIKGLGIIANPTGVNGTYLANYNGTPATMYVTHAGGNWGLTIQRASGVNPASGANLTFYQNYGTDFNTLVPVDVGAGMGQITWLGTTTDLTARRGLQLIGYAWKVGTNYIAAGYEFKAFDTTGSLFRTIMHLHPTGNLLVGTGSANQPDKLRIEGTALITDTFKTPNITQKGDTSNYKPVVVDANGNHFKMSGWPLTAPVYTFNNGITNTAGTVQLGGALTQATTISSATAANNILITGVNTSSETAMLKVTTTGASGFAIHGESSTGRGVYGVSGSSGIGVYGNNTSTGTGVFGNNSSSGYGGQFSSSSGVGLYAISSGSHGAEIFTNRSSTNTTVPIFKLYRLSQSAAGNGVGGTLEFNINTTQGAGFSILANELVSKLTTATAGAEVSQFEITSLNGGAGTRARKFALTGAGQAIFDGYGSGTFTGTSTNMLATTSGGSIIEVPVNLTGSATLDFPNTAAGAKSDLTITVTGAADGDVVAIGVPNASTVANGCFTAWVSGANTVTVRYTNNDLTTAYDPASGSFKATIIKH